MTQEKAIKNAIKGAGFTLDQAAKELEMARTTFYSHIGKGEIDVDFIENVRTKLGVDINQVIRDLPSLEITDMKAKKPEVIALGKKVPTRLTSDQFKDAFPDWEGVPVYNVEVSASFVEKYTEEESKWQPLYHLRDPQFKDCNFAARIAGDSMHSEIRHGDYIICQEIVDISIIVYGEIYYVVTSNGLETCKYVNAMPIYSLDPKDTRKMYDYDRVLLVPKNDNISPTPLNKTDITRLYKVKGIVRGY